ncbi:hypothetical protein [Paenibacillus sp. PL2-23]|uniref:hypothetical protein n=1 Tax=Paenibacillus sp. PL2-23 TaxID=2100729 RepID=UPI0030FB2249
MHQQDEWEGHGGRKQFFVSVQAGQILEDPEAAAYELAIYANDEEVARLRELFEELASMDEAEVAHFAHTPYGTSGDETINAASDEIVSLIYKQLYECGTGETKRHIESMGIL